MNSINVFNSSPQEESQRPAEGYGRLRKFILSCMILAPIVIYISSLGVGYFYFANSLHDNTIASIKRIVKDHRHMLSSFLSERQADLLLISNLYSYARLTDPAALKSVFEFLREKSSAFSDLGVFDHQGVHVNYYGRYDLAGKNYSQETWFKEVMERGHYTSNVFKGFRNVPHFIVAVANESDGKKWVIRATIDTIHFNELVEQVSIGKTGEAYILNRSGILQTRKRSGGELMQDIKQDSEYLQSHDGIRVFEHTAPGGQTYLVSTTWLNEGAWMLVVRQKKSDAFRSLTTAARIITVVTVLGILIIVIVSILLSSKIIQRMNLLDEEKEKLQLQLVRAGSLAELGEMATGFAHEINNPLQIIKNEQTLIKMYMDDLCEKGGVSNLAPIIDAYDSVDQIGVQIERCAAITQAILKFGRAGEPVCNPIVFKHFIPEIIGMVEKKAFVHGIDFQYHINEEIPPAYGDPAQMQQIILNLINNAIDAVIERHGSSGGKIDLTVARNGEHSVYIQIKDNGVGISSENQRKIFTPFFTTKPVGKGTGLGLSVCYGIINKMGGKMDVKSEPGQGSVFTVHFPVQTER